MDWKRFREVNELYAVTAGQAVDIEKFNHIALTTHSARIEESTLTENEVLVLINDGLSTKDKDQYSHDMVIDHYEGLKFVLSAAKEKRKISPGAGNGVGLSR